MLLFTLTTLLASFLFVIADPTPTAPGPGDSFNEGANCTFTWNGDTNTSSTTWKAMNVELMSGSNSAMTHVTTVAANLDGTVTTTTHSYLCPNVTPNSAIYFYQFTSPLSPDIMWTTRFTIADATGQSTPPTEAKQPNGDPIPWGNGALVDPSLAVAPPTIGGSSASASSVLPVSSISSSSLVTSSTSASSTPTPATTSSDSSSDSGGSVTSSSSAPTGTNNALGLVVDSRAWQSVVALGAAAFTFTFLL